MQPRDRLRAAALAILVVTGFRIGERREEFQSRIIAEL
jgi:hypothetical protein